MQNQLLHMSLSDNDISLKACQSLRDTFQKCSKKKEKENSFNTVLKYLDNFIGDEQERGVLMDRIFDLVIELGKIRFDSKHQYLNYEDTTELFE